jgi:hypothetical protein
LQEGLEPLELGVRLGSGVERSDADTKELLLARCAAEE